MNKILCCTVIVLLAGAYNFKVQMLRTLDLTNTTGGGELQWNGLDNIGQAVAKGI